MTELQQFRCEPYDAWLTRDACALRFKRATEVKRRGDASVVFGDRRCTPCAVGCAHAKGKAPQLVKLRTVELPPPVPHEPATGVCARCLSTFAQPGKTTKRLCAKCRVKPCVAKRLP